MDILMKTPELYPDFVKSEKYISIHSYVKNTLSFQTSSIVILQQLQDTILKSCITKVTNNAIVNEIL